MAADGSEDRDLYALGEALAAEAAPPGALAARYGAGLEEALDVQAALRALGRFGPEEGPPQPAAPAVERLPRYAIRGEIARGGMGVVYRAWDRELRREVALKALLRLRGTALERFQREAQALARLRHPGVVRVHDAGVVDEQPYLVMELLEGESLAGVLAREGPLSGRRSAEVAVQLARALEHAHARGILHRDVKPANVILCGDRAVLTDFGVALDTADAERLTATGAMVGTPAYMAPEQALGAAALDGRADVFGLGATLLASLLGAERRVATPWTPAALRVEGVADARLAAVARRCLEADPDRRYATAGELATDLERYLAGEAPAAAGDRRRRWPWLAGAAGAALAAALVLSTLQARAVTAALREWDGAGCAAESSCGAHRLRRYALGYGESPLALDELDRRLAESLPGPLALPWGWDPAELARLRARSAAHRRLLAHGAGRHVACAPRGGAATDLAIDGLLLWAHGRPGAAALQLDAAASADPQLPGLRRACAALWRERLKGPAVDGGGALTDASLLGSHLARAAALAAAREAAARWFAAASDQALAGDVRPGVALGEALEARGLAPDVAAAVRAGKGDALARRAAAWERALAAEGAGPGPVLDRLAETLWASPRVPLGERLTAALTARLGDRVARWEAAATPEARLAHARRTLDLELALRYELDGVPSAPAPLELVVELLEGRTQAMVAGEPPPLSLALALLRTSPVLVPLPGGARRHLPLLSIARKAEALAAELESLRRVDLPAPSLLLTAVDLETGRTSPRRARRHLERLLSAEPRELHPERQAEAHLLLAALLLADADAQAELRAQAARHAERALELAVVSPQLVHEACEALAAADLSAARRARERGMARIRGWLGADLSRRTALARECRVELARLAAAAIEDALAEGPSRAEALALQVLELRRVAPGEVLAAEGDRAARDLVARVLAGAGLSEEARELSR